MALHHAARASLIAAMTELVMALPDEGPRLLQARAIFRTACAHAGETAAQIVDKLAAETGAASIFEAYPLERYVRDTHAAIKHIAMSASSYIVAGRLGLGLDPGTIRF
jgi:alkylation response protein AidB-like acyl-CoA dehydrogenase